MRHDFGSASAELSHRNRTAVWLRVGALAALVAGLLPIASAPLLGDDPVVLATGVTSLRVDGDLVLYIADTVRISTSGNHVLPVGGFVTSLTVALTASLGSLGLEIAPVWGAIRVVLIIAALAAVAWAVAQLLEPGMAHVSKQRRSERTFEVFTLAGAVFLAAMQVHGLWSQDPLLSYSLASWLTPLLVFATVGCLLRGLWTEHPRRWFLLALALSLVGPFVYEPYVVGLLSAIPVLLLSFRHLPDVTGLGRRRVVALCIVGLSAATFGAGQVWRLRQESNYAGTAAGFAEMFVPVWQTAVLGYLPLTNTRLTLELAEAHEPSLVQVVWIVTMSLVLVLIWHFTRKPQLRDSWWAALLFIFFLFLFALGAAGLVALSRKYQLEIGLDVGRTYLFYGIGLLVTAATVAVLAQFLPVRRPIVLIGSLLVLLPLAFAQWVVNSMQLAAIETTYGWTREIGAALDGSLPMERLCSLNEALHQASVPDFYRESIVADLERLYWGNETRGLCPSDEHGADVQDLP